MTRQVQTRVSQPGEGLDLGDAYLGEEAASAKAAVAQTGVQCVR